MRYLRAAGHADLSRLAVSSLILVYSPAVGKASADSVDADSTHSFTITNVSKAVCLCFVRIEGNHEPRGIVLNHVAHIKSKNS